MLGQIDGVLASARKLSGGEGAMWAILLSLSGDVLLLQLTGACLWDAERSTFHQIAPGRGVLAVALLSTFFGFACPVASYALRRVFGRASSSSGSSHEDNILPSRLRSFAVINDNAVALEVFNRWNAQAASGMRTGSLAFATLALLVVDAFHDGSTIRLAWRFDDHTTFLAVGFLGILLSSLVWSGWQDELDSLIYLPGHGIRSPGREASPALPNVDAFARQPPTPGAVDQGPAFLLPDATIVSSDAQNGTASS